MKKIAIALVSFLLFACAEQEQEALQSNEWLEENAHYLSVPGAGFGVTTPSGIRGMRQLTSSGCPDGFTRFTDVVGAYDYFCSPKMAIEAAVSMFCALAVNPVACGVYELGSGFLAVSPDHSGPDYAPEENRLEAGLRIIACAVGEKIRRDTGECVVADQLDALGELIDVVEVVEVEAPEIDGGGPGGGNPPPNPPRGCDQGITSCDPGIHGCKPGLYVCKPRGVYACCKRD